MTQKSAHELLPVFKQLAGYLGPTFTYELEIGSTDFDKGTDWNIVIHETNTDHPEGEQPPMFMYAADFLLLASAFRIDGFVASCGDCGTVTLTIH